MGDLNELKTAAQTTVKAEETKVQTWWQKNWHTVVLAGMCLFVGYLIGKL